MKAGILYPGSQAYPAADLNFVNGIRASLATAGLSESITLILDSIGNGGSEKDVYTRAEKLLRMDDADIVVAFADLKVVPLLEPLFFASGKMLLVVNPGANHPANWIAQPNVIYLSLGHAFLSWMCGRLAALHGHREAAVATTFYDCGYLHSAAMVRSFMDGGGQPAYNYISNQAYDAAFETGALNAFLAANPQVRALLCTFDATPAGLLYQRLLEAGLDPAPQLYVSPMMLQPEALDALPPDASLVLHGYRPWDAGSGTPANQAFSDAFRDMTQRAPDLFALLGWEAGIVLGAMLGSGALRDCEALTAALAGEKLCTPRGGIWLDRGTNHYMAPVLQCSRTAAGELAQTELPASQVREAWMAFSGHETEGLSSGWTNTYLCY